MNQFIRLAPYIQDYIYREKWEHLRDIQISAIDAILDTNDNILLSSGTASGKTEAVFLPVLTDLYFNPSKSVGVLYISPLKSLINDQFVRLDGLLIESNMIVTKWHGDASDAKKQKLIKKPQGILQITPESLESIITNKQGATISLFADLRYIIIDELHYFMQNGRGVQLLSILERIQRIVNIMPRRIGLSATLGCIKSASIWLCTGGMENIHIISGSEYPRKIKLYVERFANESPFNFLYKMTLDKKTIIFTNSRQESEFAIANLKYIAKRKKTPDVYRVHHGNVSTFLREQAEQEMKTSEENIITAATVTLELGIDIGSLDQVVQLGAPISVSSFAQRLGRCGRKGQIPQMLFITTEDIPDDINWELIRIIAIIELYKERWIEPIRPITRPYNLLYHQTMCILKSGGEYSPAFLAQSVLTLGCFKYISQDDYIKLLKFLIEIEQLEKTEHGGLIIGRLGEKEVSSYDFLSVFTTPDYLLVKDENRTIGTVDKIYPVGERFALAGLTWEVLDVNKKSKIIFVKKVPGISIIEWDVDFDAYFHTRLVQKMREVLINDDSYSYLSQNASNRLNEIKEYAKSSGITNNLVTAVSDKKFIIFPWIGTREIVTLNYAINKRRIKSILPWARCVYLEILFDGNAKELEDIITEIKEDIDLELLPLLGNVQIKGKYNEFVPPSLLKKQFIYDFLSKEF